MTLEYVRPECKKQAEPVSRRRLISPVYRTLALVPNALLGLAANIHCTPYPTERARRWAPTHRPVAETSACRRIVTPRRQAVSGGTRRWHLRPSRIDSRPIRRIDHLFAAESARADEPAAYVTQIRAEPTRHTFETLVADLRFAITPGFCGGIPLRLGEPSVGPFCVPCSVHTGSTTPTAAPDRKNVFLSFFSGVAWN